MNKIIERIERELGMPNLATRLAQELSPTDLQSLLLEVYRQRAERRRPAEVLADYENDRFVQPGRVPPLLIQRWEQTAFEQLPPEFEPLVLSPVAPLGTNSVVATVDQNWAVSTVRNTEVVSDSTNVLALECALRRRALLATQPKSRTPVHLATAHRLLRAQQYDNPAFSSHFSIFSLCSAGRDMGNFQFELGSATLHLRSYLTALRAYLGPKVPLRVTLSDVSRRIPERLLSSALSPLETDFPNVEFALDPERTRAAGYYENVAFLIHATAPSGEEIELADGGSVNWTQQLLSNAKERLVISGIGSERVCTAFGERRNTESH